MQPTAATSPQTSTAIPVLLRRSGCLLMMAAAVGAPFIGTELGALDPCDESYQTLCVASYNSQPAAPATFAVGQIWQNLFGHEALTLRYLGVLCVVTSIAIGALWFYLRRGNALQASALMLAASLTATPAIFRIYNWDTGAYPAEALALVCALALWHRPRMWKSVLLGALCALLFLCRVQLIVCLPLALWLACAALHRDRLKCAALTLGAFCIAWLALSILIFGSPCGHIDAIASGNFISGHSPAAWRHILWRAWADALDLPLAWLPLAAAICCGIVWQRYPVPCGWRGIFLGILLCGWVFLASAVTATFYDGIIFAGDLPLFLTVAVLPWLLRCPRIPRSAIWICVISVILTAFGSDAIAERYFSSYALAPLVAVVLPGLGQGGRRLLWSIVAFAAFAGGCTTVMRYLDMSRVNTYAMDGFALQHGLKGSGRDMMYWSSVTREVDARNGRRIRFVCRPYGLMLTYGEKAAGRYDFHKFHFFDGDLSPLRDDSGALLYDSYVFTLARPEEYPFMLREFTAAGYMPVKPDQAARNGEYFILELHSER